MFLSEQQERKQMRTIKADNYPAVSTALPFDVPA
jgi:hypothetical protein